MELDFDFEHDKKQIIEIDGYVATGKQFDLEIKVDEDHRNVIFGVVKDHFNKPIKDAVVKLIEVTKYDRKPVSHTFTSDDGEFVFGPLCADKSYAIDIWANKVEHVKICKEINTDRKCLKGVDLCCEKPYPIEDDCECEKE